MKTESKQQAKSKQCGERGKAGRGKWQPGVILWGRSLLEDLPSLHSRKHRCTQQGATGPDPCVGGSAGVVIKERQPGLPYATHPCVGTHTRPGRGGRRLSLIWKLGGQGSVGVVWVILMLDGGGTQLEVISLLPPDFWHSILKKPKHSSGNCSNHVTNSNSFNPHSP